jgi:predicted aldo/keto reductase-like oxidoreductase
MKYRKLGKLDWDVSVLGFGAMRLPLADKETQQVDEPEATKMVRYAIDRGVNYVPPGKGRGHTGPRIEGGVPREGKGDHEDAGVVD